MTWFCHNLNRHASLLRNVLTGNQTALFYFQVGIYSAVLSLHFGRTKYMYILRVVQKKQFTCKNLCVFLYLYILIKNCRGQEPVEGKKNEKENVSCIADFQISF